MLEVVVVGLNTLAFRIMIQLTYIQLRFIKEGALSIAPSLSVCLSIHLSHACMKVAESSNLLETCRVIEVTGDAVWGQEGQKPRSHGLMILCVMYRPRDMPVLCC